MNKIVKDALLLTLITLVSGCALGLVHEVTAAPIQAANEAATAAAYQEVFPDAESFNEIEIDTAAAETVKATYADDDIEAVVEALDGSGSVLGYVLTITSHAGYGGDITFSIGVTNEGVLNGYSITDISETAGLGMKAKEEKFSSQFNGVTFDSDDSYLEVTKVDPSGSIEAISGATITSKAVTYGVDAGLMYFRTVLQ
ncbi:MAG: RnfABCDGE type electron transport complex subunit G [Lachnospiraceae bacterium]|nr:RnfABCDGE type electron transport complex subunit G [Lachnospiraceae bacterium]